VPVISSGGEHAVMSVGPDPCLVVATPGAEPVAEGGYAAVLILDAHLHLMRTALRAGEETARRWVAAAALGRPGSTAVVTADASSPAVQALVRWDPGWLAQRELAERAELGLPPAVRSAMLTGTPAAVEEAARQLPEAIRVVGPIPSGDRARLLVTAPRVSGDVLARALHAIAATRSARKDPEPLAICVDPLDWGGD
ncbi:MAG: primosome assembly protein PriA, partial [bacterium]